MLYRRLSKPRLAIYPPHTFLWTFLSHGTSLHVCACIYQLDVAATSGAVQIPDLGRHGIPMHMSGRG